VSGSVSSQGQHIVTLDDETLAALADGNDEYEFTIRGSTDIFGNADEVRLEGDFTQGATQTRDDGRVYVEYDSIVGSVFIQDEVDVSVI